MKKSCCCRNGSVWSTRRMLWFVAKCNSTLCMYFSSFWIIALCCMQCSHHFNAHSVLLVSTIVFNPVVIFLYLFAYQ